MDIESLFLLLIGCVYICGVVSGAGLHMLLTYSDNIDGM